MRKAIQLFLALSLVPKKITVIRLRWPVIISCSYWLLLSDETWLGPTFIQGIILFYILSNLGLYFVNKSAFDSSYLYFPLLCFDTLFINVSVIISGRIEGDFYLVYFLILFLVYYVQDFRRLTMVAGLAILLYGYLLFDTTETPDVSFYLGLPFLFSILLLYGYLAQVVRVEKLKKSRGFKMAL